MRYWILILLIFMPFPASAQNVVAPAVMPQVEQRTLVRNIIMEGFQLQDKNQFVKMFKSYRNKYLSKDDMDMLLQKVQDIYEQEGFQQLVSIKYAVNKHNLIFTVALTS